MIVNISKSAFERALSLAQNANDVSLVDELLFGNKLAHKVWFWQKLLAED